MVSDGLKSEPTVSDSWSPDKMLSPERGPFGSPHASANVRSLNATVMTLALIVRPRGFWTPLITMLAACAAQRCCISYRAGSADLR